jgi:hypothetical protein
VREVGFRALRQTDHADGEHGQVHEGTTASRTVLVRFIRSGYRATRPPSRKNQKGTAAAAFYARGKTPPA